EVPCKDRDAAMVFQSHTEYEGGEAVIRLRPADMCTVPGTGIRIADRALAGPSSITPRAGALSLEAPSLRCNVVRRARLDPARAGAALLLLPERSARLQIVHDELASGKRIAPVSAGDHHQHDLVQRLERSDPVDDQRVEHLPAPARLSADLLDRLLGPPPV